MYRFIMAIKFRPETPKPVVAKNAATAPKPSRKGVGGRPAKADKLVAATLRFPPDVLARLQAKGKDWRQIAVGLIAAGLR